jgi:putative transposase
MFDVSKCVAQEAIIDLGAAFRSFFEKRGRYTRVKRKDGRASFCAANEAGTFRADGKKIKLPVIGWIRMREAVRFSGPLKRATVSREADRWFVSVMIDTDDVKPVAQPYGPQGVAPDIAYAGVQAGQTRLRLASIGGAALAPVAREPDDATATDGPSPEGAVAATKSPASDATIDVGG